MLKIKDGKILRTGASVKVCRQHWNEGAFMNIFFKGLHFITIREIEKRLHKQLKLQKFSEQSKLSKMVEHLFLLYINFCYGAGVAI
jgi:hypothetical protein